MQRAVVADLGPPPGSFLMRLGETGANILPAAANALWASSWVENAFV